jgi:hypothetical protein
MKTGVPEQRVHSTCSPRSKQHIFSQEQRAAVCLASQLGAAFRPLGYQWILIAPRWTERNMTGQAQVSWILWLTWSSKVDLTFVQGSSGGPQRTVPSRIVGTYLEMFMSWSEYFSSHFNCDGYVWVGLPSHGCWRGSRFYKLHMTVI